MRQEKSLKIQLQPGKVDFRDRDIEEVSKQTKRGETEG